MELFNRITKERYEHPNTFSSTKFVDFMITDLIESVDYEVPEEYRSICEAVRAVYRFTRYEPTNPYVFHKSVPAARNIHTNEAYLILDGDVIRYNVKKDTFECIKHIEDDNGTIRLISVAEMWRVMKFYGEFGAVLPLLDAGHILSQLKLELDRRNITRGDIIFGPKKKDDYEMLSLSPKSNMITVQIELSSNPSKRSFSRIKHSYARSMNYDYEVGKYDVARDILSYEAGERKETMTFSGDPLPPFEREEKREAAHNFDGLFSISETIEDWVVEDMLSQLQKHLKRYMSTWKHFCVHVIYRSDEKECYRRLDASGIGEEQELKVDRNQLLHDYKKTIDMLSMPVCVYISYLYQEELSEKENIYVSHIGAAELSQYLLLQAPKYGLFSRPMRNMEDAYLDRTLPHLEEEHFMYSVIMGKANSKNVVRYL